MKARSALGTDPRTIAREVAGVFETVFPQLAPSVVGQFNRTRLDTRLTCKGVDERLVARSRLQPALLFELALVVAEQLLDGHREPRWEAAVSTAVERQQVYFDAKGPSAVTEGDEKIAYIVATNLVSMLRGLQREVGGTVDVSPRIPGFRWISSGRGDFAVGPSLVEVKCTRRRFSSADYRQIVTYWLLQYIAAIESGGACWDEGVLVNPRSGSAVRFVFRDLVTVISAGRSLVEVTQVFEAVVADRVPDGLRQG